MSFAYWARTACQDLPAGPDRQNSNRFRCFKNDHYFVSREDTAKYDRYVGGSSDSCRLSGRSSSVPSDPYATHHRCVNITPPETLHPGVSHLASRCFARAALEGSPYINLAWRVDGHNQDVKTVTYSEYPPASLWIAHPRFYVMKPRDYPWSRPLESLPLRNATPLRDFRIAPSRHL